MLDIMSDETPPALSRADNKTDICRNCGFDEAMRQMNGVPVTNPSEWPIKRMFDELNEAIRTNRKE